MNKETGEPAFPLFAATGYTGMTLRDYFAAKAMQQLMKGGYFGDAAMQAYAMADAMLKEREK